MLISFCLFAAAAVSTGPGFFVDVFPASEQYPRNSEGSVIELADGSLLLATSRFYGGAEDAAAANIMVRRSSDGGKTWSDPVVLQENVGTRNVMSASLLRLTDAKRADGKRGAGPIGFFYLVKNSRTELKVYLRTSNDEAKTWSEPVCVTDAPGYHVMNNDRVCRMRSGRLVCPIALDPDGKNHFVSFCYFSDNQGKTWTRGQGIVDAPKRGAMEPELIERSDGTLLMLVRTQMGRNYAAVSPDGGNTWGEAAPFGPAAPEAPSTLRRMPGSGDWLLIFNDNVQAGAGHGGKRTPLTSAISTDEGATWTHVKNIETRTDQTYAYTSLIFVNDTALMTYYVFDDSTRWLTTRFRSVPIKWFYAER